MANSLPPPRAVVLCDPANFTVEEAANPFSLSPSGSLNVVDAAVARSQWDALAAAYDEIGLPVWTIPAQTGLPDQVFTANPIFAYPTPDGGAFLQSHMRYPARQPEVDATSTFLEAKGLQPVSLPGDAMFEGGGDLIWQGRRRQLIGGHGFRSTEESIRAAAKIVDAPVLTVQLIDPRFYHLDTCLATLGDDTAAWVPAAFDAEAKEAILEHFGELIEIPFEEALTFAGNLHCPDGERVVIDAANRQTAASLADSGYDVILVETGEFRKSGGSVYCMKHIVW